MTFIFDGDVVERLRHFPEASFDACLCDPPYGLSGSDKRNMRRATPRASSRARAAGFMGMEWDAKVPGPEVWAEINRVLKPGAPLLAFGGTRTFHRLVCAIEDGGLIVTDTICWLYGQGFPKAKGLKPAWEPITVAWKKGKRRLSVDACRVPVHDAAYERNCSGDRGHGADRARRMDFQQTAGSASPIGRWPANLILDETAAELLDQQTGILASGANPTRRHSPKTRNAYGEFVGSAECTPHRGADKGGASRFFYCAKATAKERGEGNTHPTVKPLRLCEYLARLILPDRHGATLLVPYSGSGSEIVGARRAGWPNIIGIEREPAYIDIAKRRLSAERRCADHRPNPSANHAPASRHRDG